MKTIPNAIPFGCHAPKPTSKAEKTVIEKNDARGVRIEDAAFQRRCHPGHQRSIQKATTDKPGAAKPQIRNPKQIQMEGMKEWLKAELRHRRGQLRLGVAASSESPTALEYKRGSACCLQ
jgi:hypothetical protein